MKAGALFDMDGLLFDTERVYNQQWNVVAYEHGLRIHPEMLDELRGTNGVLMCNIVNRYWPDVNAQALIDSVFDKAQISLAKEVPLKRGALDILDYFHDRHIRMAIASSAPRILIEKNLKVANIRHYFDAIVSGEQVTHGKPSPDIYILASTLLQLDPKDCYVFEDGVHGAYAGIRAGCETYMIPDLVPPTEELLSLCAGIVSSLTDMKKLLMKQEDMRIE